MEIHHKGTKVTQRATKKTRIELFSWWFFVRPLCLCGELLLHSRGREFAEVVEETHERGHEFLEVALVQALVRCVGIAQRVFDAHEQRRRAAEGVRERRDEAD